MYHEKISTPRDYDPVIRPSSAKAKLQSHAIKEIVENVRPSTAAAHLAQGNFVSQAREIDLSSRPSTVNARPALKQDRRLTLSEVYGIAEHGKLLRRLNTPASNFGKIKIEERISLDQLHRIKTAFEEADVDGSGTLDIDEFKQVVKNCLGVSGRHEDQIVALFMKIDSSSDGEIDWNEFCTYMQLEYAEKEEAVQRSKRVMFTLPVISVSSPHHKSPVLKIFYVAESTLMCCSQEGLLSFWTTDLKMKRCQSIASNVSGIASYSLKSTLWVTDISFLSTHNKIVVSSGDRNIQFYELSTMELYCRLTGLDTVPLCLDVTEIDAESCVITYGDDQGCVSILKLQQVGEHLRLWKKAAVVNGAPTVHILDIVNAKTALFVKWKVHDDWITKLKYYHDLNSVISSCNHTGTALVRGCITPSTQLGELEGLASSLSGGRTPVSRHQIRHTLQAQRRKDVDQSVFRVYKGVRTFDFCKERNILATGGLDRVLRLWNPYMPQKPTGYLQGHNAPILFAVMSGTDDRIFSISADKVIKVWDLVEQTCLVTLSQKLHKIRSDILTCVYNDTHKSLAIVTDHIYMLNTERRRNVKDEMPVSHMEPVTCVGYNASFNHVITCSEGSVVKLWDFDTGNFMFEFNKVHGNSAITCMTFDKSGRRLVTGGRDGAVRIWNYNNGHCLRTLIPDHKPPEIAECLYVEMNRNTYIVGVGWDKKINIYADDTQDFRHIQRPENKWKDYSDVGHKEDIVAAAYGIPYMLATVSYDGVINVWNFVSGHIICCLPYPEPPASWNKTDEDEEQRDQAVNKLVFINSRVPNKSQACLIAGCADGSLMFWNVTEKKIFARCIVTKQKCPVSAMYLTSDDRHLYIGDVFGYIRTWDIEKYALSFRNHVQTTTPTMLHNWRAHVKLIASICYVEKHGFVLSASADHSVRIWSNTGEYIGTFGQDKPWDFFDRNTWQHPMVPREVLFDPRSMPEHSVLAERKSVIDVVHADSLEASDSEDEDQVHMKQPGKPTETRHHSAGVQRLTVHKPSSRRSSGMWVGGGDAWRRKLSRRLTRASFTTQEGFFKNEEQALLNEVRKSMTKSAGKRLRHEKLLSSQRQRNLHLDASAHAFQSLQCFDLQSAVEVNQKPNPREHIDDPFVLVETDAIEEGDERSAS